MPKNYDEMIVKATRRIANYYEQKLLDHAGNFSVDTYNRIKGKIKKMNDSATDAEYYGNYSGELSDLDLRTWTNFVVPFFSAAYRYIEQRKRGISDPDRRAVDTAITKLYARIGKNIEPLVANPKQKPMDIEKSVADTVEKIAKFYEIKLEKIKDKLSEKKYQEMQNGIAVLRSGADVNNTDYFNNYGWFDIGVLRYIDEEKWESTSDFFIVVANYVKAKEGMWLSKEDESEIIKAIKMINLKIGGGIFAEFKNVFLPAGHFMTRRDM